MVEVSKIEEDLGSVVKGIEVEPVGRGRVIKLNSVERYRGNVFVSQPENYVVYAGVKIADGSNIGTGCYFIECSLGHHVTVGRQAFFSPGTEIGDFAHVGALATFLASAKIGHSASFGSRARFGSDLVCGEGAKFGAYAYFESKARFFHDTFFDDRASFGYDTVFGSRTELVMPDFSRALEAGSFDGLRFPLDEKSVVLRNNERVSLKSYLEIMKR